MIINTDGLGKGIGIAGIWIGIGLAIGLGHVDSKFADAICVSGAMATIFYGIFG
jgi:hypothetical protein